MAYYAQVQNGKVTAVSEGPSIMIRIPSYDARLLGTTFNGSDPAFADESVFDGYKATIAADKTEIAADGVETVTVSITIKSWKDEPSPSFNGTIRLNINGSRKDLTVANGAASYSYKTTTIGSKLITTQDTDATAYISHGSVTIDAYGNLEEL